MLSPGKRLAEKIYIHHLLKETGYYLRSSKHIIPFDTQPVSHVLSYSRHAWEMRCKHLRIKHQAESFLLGTEKVNLPKDTQP